MPSKKRIIICGQSVFMLAVETILAEQPEFDVLRLHPHLPGIVERIVSRLPHAVIVEQADAEHPDKATLSLELLRRNVPLVELNTRSNKFQVLNQPPITISSAEELIAGIKQMVAKEDVLMGDAKSSIQN